MKYVIIFFVALLNIPVFGQQNSPTNRKAQIEKLTEKIYSIYEFHQIADSLQLSIDELCDYPVIFPIKKPQRISS